jgi:hypothetical protein
VVLIREGKKLSTPNLPCRFYFPPYLISGTACGDSSQAYLSNMQDLRKKIIDEHQVESRRMVGSS